MFKRTEQEVREYLEAITAAKGHYKECDCIGCSNTYACCVATIDVFNWLLGIEPTEEFQRDSDGGKDFDFLFVQELITRYRLGEFNLPTSTH